AALNPLSLVYMNRPASAGATYTPTRFDDPAPDGCQPADCSLREAIIAANENPGNDTVTLTAGQYEVNLMTSFHGEPVTAALSIIDSTTVIGQGADRTTLQGYGVGGVFTIQHPTFAPISVHIADLAIHDGLRDGGGGAVYAASGVSLNITRVTMTGNGGGGGSGGAILSNYGIVTITDSTIANNWAQFGGGISANRLTITNSTVSGNRAMIDTAGIGSGNATLTNVTVTGNSTPYNSLGLGGVAGAGTIVNSIIAGNTGRQCSGLTSLGHNLYGDNSCGSGPGDIVSTDPMLGPLADNGGPTQTHALLADSPAIDAGDNNACPSADQRGYGRVGACDIGAYEYAPPPTPPPTPKPIVVAASPTPAPTAAPESPTPTPKPSPSPTAKSSPSPTPRHSQTPSPSPTSSGDEEGGGGGLIIGLALGGLAVAGASGGGGYYLWRRSVAGLRLWPPWT
ncbi:MAG TPA: choice-of-anchor Q domain-containing protein, partial [Dehalococcoidia bacterium]|nr:choice-of-anchor Q domain-containing protein [Dehalococcoidia bacterium]